LVHVDWHASHYVKTFVDEIFGKDHFICEFIWRMFSPHLSKGKKSPAKIHQSILAYSKTATQFQYYPQYIPYRDYYRQRARKDPSGRLWVDQNLGLVSRKKIEELKELNRVYTTKKGNLRRKQYLEDMPGEPVGTLILHIDRINSQSKERTGFETQKPEALLDLLVRMFTKEGDLVGDFFCGSGTTPVVAQRLQRRWIACDNNRTAIDIALNRLKQLGITLRVKSI
jgi:DNA modification methylase